MYNDRLSYIHLLSLVKYVVFRGFPLWRLMHIYNYQLIFDINIYMHLSQGEPALPSQLPNKHNVDKNIILLRGCLAFGTYVKFMDQLLLVLPREVYIKHYVIDHIDYTFCRYIHSLHILHAPILSRFISAGIGRVLRAKYLWTVSRVDIMQD